jgi:hypothetical protein
MSKIEVDAIEPQSGTNLTVGASGDTVTVTNNDIRSNAYKASDGGNLVSQSGTTITLGASGDTVSIASGATLVGGGTDWQSAVKTSTFTAVAGEGYFINTTGGAITVNLPAGNVGDVVELVDALGTFTTNNLTISANGSEKIQNSTNDVSLTKINAGVRLVYSGSTSGWVIPTSNAGTTGPYTANFLVIAGGGGTSRDNGGGGGAGGYRTSFNSEASGGGGSSESSLALTVGQTYTIAVGGGGATGGSAHGANGDNSSISGTGITTITSTGGGGGGSRVEGQKNGRDGGSGGGGSYNVGSTYGNGTANQGYRGGGNGNDNAPAAGGGGAGAVGANNGDGSGGNGVASTISGSSVTRAGGGGGGTNSGSVPPGGSGGGGAGGVSNDGVGGSTNTGGGAGGGGNNSTTGSAGGSGVVILRVATANYSGSTSGSPVISTNGSDTIMVFNGDGSYTA